jgi:hypothetical protein
LDGAKRFDTERSSAFLLCDHAVAERHLGVEAVDKDALVLLYHAVRDAHVTEREVRKLGNVAGILGAVLARCR